MSGVPRSQRLLVYTFSAVGNSPQFVCPAATVTLVKSIYFTNNAATQLRMAAFIGTAQGGHTQVIYGIDVPALQAVWSQAWVVMHPGDALWAYSAAATATTYISGAILQGGPLYPSAELMDPLVWPPEDLELPPAGTGVLSTAGLPESGPSLKGRGRSARRA